MPKKMGLFGEKYEFEICVFACANKCLLFFFLIFLSVCRRPIDSDAVNMSCAFQRSWILLSNICHGLLAGLALAHILFVVTITPKDLLSGSFKPFTSTTEIYTNTFYCLAVLCLVSIFDRYV